MQYLHLSFSALYLLLVFACVLKYMSQKPTFTFLDDFDTVVLSYEVGTDKPNKEIFQELVNKSDVEANEIFYSDDDETKMEGAKELGINTFLYTDFDAFVEHLEGLGVKL